MGDGDFAGAFGVEEEQEPSDSGVDVEIVEGLGDVLQGGEGVKEVVHVEFELGFSEGTCGVEEEEEEKKKACEMGKEGSWEEGGERAYLCLLGRRSGE